MSRSDVINLYRLLQLNGGTFPTGGFSQSWGIETYVSEGMIEDAEGFGRLLSVYLRSTVGRCEGPIIVRAMDTAKAIADRDPDPGTEDRAMEELLELEKLSVASRVTGESREGSLRMGRAFLRVTGPLMKENNSNFLKRLRQAAGGDLSYPVAYGVVCGLVSMNREDVVTAHIFSSANTLVQSALKLIPLGNIEAQQVMRGVEEELDEILRLCMKTEIDDITNFCPGLDIAGLRHEELAVRLYMS